MELAKPKYYIGQTVQLVGDNTIKGQIIGLAVDLCYASASQVTYNVRLFNRQREGSMLIDSKKFVEIEIEPYVDEFLEQTDDGENAKALVKELIAAAALKSKYIIEQKFEEASKYRNIERDIKRSLTKMRSV